MDIDLFLSKLGLCGLMCQGSFKEPPAGILFDAEIMEMTAEFVNQDPLHFNVAVDNEMRETLLSSKTIYLGVIFEGVINETLDTPLFILNDPYSDGQTNMDKNAQTVRHVKAFDSFITNSQFAQAVHRENLENESTAQSVLHGQNMQSLAYSPHLQRQMNMEAAPQVVATPMAVPQMGVSGASSGAPAITKQPKPPTTKPESED
ncbi:MAG: hypothetical protein AAF244_01615 [Pseudomonadota bacterium]